MAGIVATMGMMAAMQVMGHLLPRVPGQGLLTRDTVINLSTGTCLYVVRWLLPLGLLASVMGGGLIDLSFINLPLLQFLILFLVTDLSRYWLHYAHHRIPFLWQFHRVHHSSRTLDATSGLRMHVVDFVQLSLLPVVVTGLLFDVRSFSPDVFVSLGFVVAGFDSFQHANLQFELNHPLRRAWDRLFNNPHFHSWHHTAHIEACGDGNYGQALTVWDRAFGTCVSQENACTDLGLSEDQHLEETMLGLQLLKPAPAAVGNGA